MCSKCFLFIFLITSHISLVAQSENIDQKEFSNQDLKSRLQYNPEDTATVQNLLTRANSKFFAGGPYDSVYYLFHRALFLSKKIDYPEGLTKSYGGLGWAYYVNNLQDSARYYLKRAIIEATKTNNFRRLTLYNLWYGWTFNQNTSDLDSTLHHFQKAYEFAIMYNDTFFIQTTAQNIIAGYIRVGKMIEATKLCLELIEVSQSSNDTLSLLLNYLTLGSIFGSMNLRDKQMKTIYAALKIPPSCPDTQLLLHVYGTAAEMYLLRHKYDSVLYYTRKTELLSQKMIVYYPAMQMVNWYNMVDAYLNTGRIDSAKLYFDRILKVINYTTPSSIQYATLGKFESMFGNADKAHEYYLKAEDEAPKDDLLSKTEAYRLLYEYYDTIGQYDKALYFLKAHELNEDSLQKNQIAFNMEYLNMEFETDKKEEEIRSLSKESAIQTIITQNQKRQKNLAYGGAIMILLTGGISFYRFRQYKNLKGKQALSNERLRISRDLHDEVGATLSGIVLYSHLAKEQTKEGKPEAAQSINIVQETASEMVNKLNDVVWLINPLQDDLGHLLERLEEYGIHLSSAKNIQFQSSVPEHLNGIKLPIDKRRSIYLFCKEAINNAVKYSQGTVIELHVGKHDQHLEFKVKDNGVGFDLQHVERGNGLNNMEKRASEIGGSFHMHSEPGSGTSVILKCKIT